MYNKKFIMLIVISIVTFLLSGCFGFKDGITLPFGEKGEKITVGGDEDGFKIEGENGDSFTIGEQDLPDGFPTDIPLADGYEIVSSLKTASNGQVMQNVTYFTTAMSFEEVWELYKNFEPRGGYEQSYEATTPGYSSFTLQNSESESISVSVAGEEGSNEVTVILSVIYNE